jgi:hypothetical protein
VRALEAARQEFRIRQVPLVASTNFLCLGGAIAVVETRRCPGCPDHNLCRSPLIDHGLVSVESPTPRRET